MKNLLLVCLVASVAAFPSFNVESVIREARPAANPVTIAKFASWMVQFEKAYETKEETVVRFDAFLGTLEKIASLTEEAKGLTTYGLNQFSDLTWAEFKAKHLQKGEIPAIPESEIPYQNVSKPRQFNHPDNWDWRRSNIITPVKNQGSCGACWAFATVSVVEAMAAKEGKGSHSYAEQQMVDCIDGGCNGGVLQHAFGYAKDNGLPNESDYPYTQKKGSCHSTNIAVKLSNMVQINSNEEDMANSLTDGGPFAIAFKVGNAFQHYSGGIMTSTDCDNENSWHAIAMVGYGIDNGNKFWIGKNQWGTGWGESGFFRARRGSSWCKVDFSPVTGWI